MPSARHLSWPNTVQPPLIMASSHVHPFNTSKAIVVMLACARHSRVPLKRTAVTARRLSCLIVPRPGYLKHDTRQVPASPSVVQCLDKPLTAHAFHWQAARSGHPMGLALSRWGRSYPKPSRCYPSGDANGLRLPLALNSTLTPSAHQVEEGIS
jgi:hypothetical protein